MRGPASVLVVETLLRKLPFYRESRELVNTSGACCRTLLPSPAPTAPPTIEADFNHEGIHAAVRRSDPPDELH